MTVRSLELRALFAAALIGGAPFTPLHGQVVNSAPGVVRGRVIDRGSGAPLAGAEIRLSGPSEANLISDAHGAWRSPSIDAGRYTVRVRAIGHLPREITIDLPPGGDVERTVALEATVVSLDQVVVTASRREQRLEDVVVTTELLTREDLERTGASDLLSVLVEQTGIELQGGHPAGAGVMLQGIGSERVLVLLDGQPLVGRISGVFDISRIPTSAVERVEVVKGPQSTLYGSEAMGGVINIITRAPEPHTVGVSAMAMAGSQNRRDGRAGLVLGRGSLATSVDVSHRTMGAAPGQGQSVGSLAARTDVSGKLRWTPDTAFLMEASVLALDERQRWRTGSFYNFSDNVQWSGSVGAVWRRGRHRLAPTIFASVYDHLARASTQSKPIAGDTGQRQIQRLYQAELLYNAPLGSSGAHALDLGLQLRHDETEAGRVDGGLRSLTSVEPFVQLEVAPAPGVSLVPGVRVSHNSEWGTHVTPRVAARWQPSDRLTLRASAGSGYRAPDFKELYMFFQNTAVGYAVVGNVDLHPETSRNITGGAEWGSERAYVRGQAFWNGFRDFIETRAITGPDEPPVFQYQNVDDGSTRGIDLEGELSVRALRVAGGYSALATRDDATGRPLLGRPTHSARSTVSHALPFGTRASATTVFTGRTPMQRDDASGEVTSWRDAFVRIDLRLAQRLAGGLELVAGADNLFDKQPAQWAGFTGRHLYTALSWSANRKTDR